MSDFETAPTGDVPVTQAVATPSTEDTVPATPHAAELPSGLGYIVSDSPTPLAVALPTVLPAAASLPTVLPAAPPAAVPPRATEQDDPYRNVVPSNLTYKQLGQDFPVTTGQQQPPQVINGQPVAIPSPPRTMATTTTITSHPSGAEERTTPPKQEWLGVAKKWWIGGGLILLLVAVAAIAGALFLKRPSAAGPAQPADPAPAATAPTSGGRRSRK